MENESMIKANYHAHTTRCMHAVGTEREYVERAILKGVRVFGFADHSPQPYPAGFVSGMRMPMEELPNYARVVRGLAEEFSREITIHLGLEAEYMPGMFDELMRRADDAGVEYFILGQHFLGPEYEGKYCGRETGDAELLHRYVELTGEGMATGRFAYFAHPDLMHYVGDPEIYERETHKLCRYAKKYRVPLEINLLGIATHRHYPNPDFWRIVGEEGCDVIWGMDAHKPEAIGDEQAEAAAQALSDRFGLQIVRYLPMDAGVFEE
ncbi:MAG: histidinol-phosphatase [Firmicutes bacterium]|nr:histidinol-phosphatase [Bacillota bacterium]